MDKCIFQNIIVYEWLPTLIGENLPEYAGIETKKICLIVQEKFSKLLRAETMTVCPFGPLCNICLLKIYMAFSEMSSTTK